MMPIERALVARRIFSVISALSALGILVLLVVQMLLGSPVDTGRILRWLQFGLITTFIVALTFRLLFRSQQSGRTSGGDPINDMYLGRTPTAAPQQKSDDYSTYPDHDT
jgi:hypothetical protein